jgi:hypothetical protein
MKINSIIHSGLVAGTVIFSSLSFGYTSYWTSKPKVVSVLKDSSGFTNLQTSTENDITEAATEVAKFSTGSTTLSFDINHAIAQLTLLTFKLNAITNVDFNAKFASSDYTTTKNTVSNLLTDVKDLNFYKKLATKHYSFTKTTAGSESNHYDSLNQLLDFAVDEHWTGSIKEKVAPQIFAIAESIKDYEATTLVNDKKTCTDAITAEFNQIKIAFESDFIKAKKLLSQNIKDSLDAGFGSAGTTAYEQAEANINTHVINFFATVSHMTTTSPYSFDIWTGSDALNQAILAEVKQSQKDVAVLIENLSLNTVLDLAGDLITHCDTKKTSDALAIESIQSKTWYTNVNALHNSVKGTDLF